MDQFVLKRETSSDKSESHITQRSLEPCTNDDDNKSVSRQKRKSNQVNTMIKESDDGCKRKKTDTEDTSLCTIKPNSAVMKVSSCGEYKLQFEETGDLKWKSLTRENLNCTYSILLKRKQADSLLQWCEDNIKYNSGELSRVRIMGKWLDIPRKQVAMGNPGLSYTFSGKTLRANPWIPVVKEIRDQLHQITGFDFNFVLINRYKDGDDHIGEHQDDEKELVAKAPIASLTLGQARDFVFKHRDARGKKASRKINTEKIELTHGMLLLMNYPTNTYWYHSLPKRKACPGVRINMTFRVFRPQPMDKKTDE